VKKFDICNFRLLYNYLDIVIISSFRKPSHTYLQQLKCFHTVARYPHLQHTVFYFVHSSCYNSFRSFQEHINAANRELPRRYNLATIPTAKSYKTSRKFANLARLMRTESTSGPWHGNTVLFMRIISQRRYVRSIGRRTRESERTKQSIFSRLFVRRIPPPQFDSSRLRPILMEYSPDSRARASDLGRRVYGAVLFPPPEL